MKIKIIIAISITMNIILGYCMFHQGSLNKKETLITHQRLNAIYRLQQELISGNLQFSFLIRENIEILRKKKLIDSNSVIFENRKDGDLRFCSISPRMPNEGPGVIIYSNGHIKIIPSEEYFDDILNR